MNKTSESDLRRAWREPEVRGLPASTKNEKKLLKTSLTISVKMLKKRIYMGRITVMTLLLGRKVPRGEVNAMNSAALCFAAWMLIYTMEKKSIRRWSSRQRKHLIMFIQLKKPRNDAKEI